MMKRTSHPSPWERDALESSYTPDELHYIRNYSMKRPKFYTFADNMYLDVETKLAALRVSPSVVSLVSYLGEKEHFQCSGTIIEHDDGDGSSIILTSASLLRSSPGSTPNSSVDDVKVVVYLSDGRSFDGQTVVQDFYYNLAVVKVKSDVPLPIASLKSLDDSIAMEPRELQTTKEKSFQLCPHSRSYHLIPGDRLIALGRYFIKPYDLMAAPGEFSLDRCEHDCKELLRANCQITRCGVGGPFINKYGEVIGVSFYDMLFTPFTPINIAIKWWEHHKKYGVSRRPWLGMDVSNFYTADLQIMEKIIQKFPNFFKGVIVEEVISGSSAHDAGICPNDVIVQCNGKPVQSLLELFELVWDTVGDSVELVVVRATDDNPLCRTMVVVDATPDKFYHWPLLENTR